MQTIICLRIQPTLSVSQDKLYMQQTVIPARQEHNPTLLQPFYLLFQCNFFPLSL